MAKPGSVLSYTLPPVGGSTAVPSFSLTHKGASAVLQLYGDWTVHTLAQVINDLTYTVKDISCPVSLDTGGIQQLDTIGALVINEMVEHLNKRGLKTTVTTVDDVHTALFEASMPVPPSAEDTTKKSSLLLTVLNGYGKYLVEMFHFAANLTAFLGQFLVLLFTSLLHPRKIRWTSLVYFIDQTGLRAVPIVSLLCFLIGMVVAYMCMDELTKFGAQNLTIKLLEVSIFREMGILITAVVVAGRSSSSFTAQIGSMVANEEVDALRSMGLNPFALLVLPRVLALIITLPMLVFVADVMGVLGGAVAICPVLDINLHGFLVQFYEGSKIWNFFVALIKAPFCALAIGLVGCYQGFQATSSAESVGFLTTVSVVQSIFLVIVIDAVFAIFFAGLGI